MLLDVDRLRIATETLATQIEAIELDLMLPPVLATAARLLKRFGGIDLTGEVRSMVLGWLRNLPESAGSDLSRSTSVLVWASHLIAWLGGDRDDPPGDLVL